MDTLLGLPLPWTRVLDRLNRALVNRGLEVVQSFDLQSARHSLANPDLCTCPYHGTAHCTCQYMVWLISLEGGCPLSLVVHGHDEWTYISLDSSSDSQVNGETRSLIRAAFAELAPIADDPSAESYPLD